MSLHPRYISFLWKVADLGSSLNMPPLRDGARLLMKIMPPGKNIINSHNLLQRKNANGKGMLTNSILKSNTFCGILCVSSTILLMKSSPWMRKII